MYDVSSSHLKVELRIRCICSPLQIENMRCECVTNFMFKLNVKITLKFNLVKLIILDLLKIDFYKILMDKNNIKYPVDRLTGPKSGPTSNKKGQTSPPQPKQHRFEGGPLGQNNFPLPRTPFSFFPFQCSLPPSPYPPCSLYLCQPFLSWSPSISLSLGFSLSPNL